MDRTKITSPLRSSHTRALSALLASTVLAYSGCGGGGVGATNDDGEFSGGKVGGFEVRPTRIDSGDRMSIRAEINDVNQSGVIVKFRYPAGLTYIRSTARLESAGDTVEIAPAVSATVGAVKYLVFDFAAESFGRDRRGRISLQLEGVSLVRTGTIAIDADYNDPNRRIGEEFTAESPRFDPARSQSIEVRDTSGATPTPTPAT